MFIDYNLKDITEPKGEITMNYSHLGIVTEDLMERHLRGEFGSNEFVKYVHEVIVQSKQLNTKEVVLSDEGKNLFNLFKEFMEQETEQGK